jgi:transposase
MNCPSCNQSLDASVVNFCPHCQTPLDVAGAKSDPESAMRQRALEAIVDQALAGAPWRDLCLDAMHTYNICPADVQAEMARRTVTQVASRPPRGLSLVVLFLTAIALALVLYFTQVHR